MTSPAPLHSTQSSALGGEFRVPGDKSISHRGLMLASQVLGKTTLSGLLEGEDVLNTARALRALGVVITRQSNGDWEVQGVGIGGLAEPSSILDMGNSGTGTRLMMGLLTPYPFTSFFTGDASLCSRPMGRVATPLAQMGAHITSRSKQRLPMALTGTPSPVPICYRLPVASAQVKSAIILAGLNTPGITTVIEPEATRDHTERMLRYLGYELTSERQADGALAISIQGQQDVTPKDRSLLIPGDPSSAAFPIVAALLVPGSDITIRGVCMNGLRTGLFDTLLEMGGNIEYLNPREVAGEDVADIRVRYSVLKAVEVPASRAPSMIDEYPILAVACALAKGKSIMHGLAELRVKESDRLNAIIEGLAACGAVARAEGDTLIVEGNGTAPRGGGTVETHMDHRIAMSFLILGMVSAQPVTVDDGHAIATSFPGFSDLMNQLGGNISSSDIHSTHSIPKAATQMHPGVVIAIDGPAASGKGTLARRLAEDMGMSYLDTGSLYRAVGLKLLYSHKDPYDKRAAIIAARSIDEEDLANPRLRQERIGQAASIVSAIPEVRQALLDFQRNFANRANGAVLDGRDIGTVVCPDADIKFFITADLESRSKRRHRELQGEGFEVVYDSVLKELSERDQRDEKRSIAPLAPADDAILIDTSKMDANTVFERVRELILQQFSDRIVT